MMVDHGLSENAGKAHNMARTWVHNLALSIARQTWLNQVLLLKESLYLTDLNSLSGLITALA
jgi:hypothetical protein